MQKDVLFVTGSSRLEKRLFLHAGHGGEQNISMRMKRFLIKQRQHIMNVSVSLFDPVKSKKSVDHHFDATLKLCKPLSFHLFLAEDFGLRCSARIEMKKQAAATIMIEAPEVRLK